MKLLAILAGALIAAACAAQTPAPITLAPGQTIVLQGKQGVQGVAGPKGDAGQDGRTGAQGSSGPSGAIGPIGPKGDAGAIGPQGQPGLGGANASCSVGTTSNGVKVSVTPQCVFSFDFSGYTQSTTTTPPVVTAPPATCPAGQVLVGNTCVSSVPATGPQTWYVRPDGGNRYSANVPAGQCDGLGDAAYPGSGVNQHCAFNDIRLLWQDGSYAYSPSYATHDIKTASPTSFPAIGWIGNGGDTYVVRGSIQSGAPAYRVGWDSANSNGCDPSLQARVGDACYRGWRGDQFSGPPSPPAGTANAHTRILGENFGNCHAQSARTPVVAGFGSGSAFNFSSSYIDFQCFDISDKSDCDTACTGQDYGTEGIGLANTADHLTLTDVRIHGMKTFGILGPTGDGTVFSYLDIIGNGGGGINFDAGDGNTGTGSLLVQNFNILWNGCSEMTSPNAYALPYDHCRDQNSGSYGDGVGTATVVTNGWHAVFDTGTVAYNTQDGLDALHFVSSNGTSSFTANNVLAYSNMGQQIKSGGDKGIITNSVIVGNCKAMSQPIPGTPVGYNTNLSDFCRASNVAILLSTNNGSTSVFKNNKVYGAGTILLQNECTTACDQPTTLIDSENNLFNGGPRDDGQGFPAAYYFDNLGDAFANPGSVNNGNTFLSVKPGTYAYEDTNSITTGTAVPIPPYGPVQ